jgi:hypothetical protein
MTDLTRQALEIAGRQHGVITTEQLAGARVAKRSRLQLEFNGVLHRQFKSVFVVAGHRATLEQRCVAVCLAHPSVFVTGATAGRLLGLRKMPRVAPITISSMHPLHIDHIGVTLRRTTKMIATDVVDRGDGIRHASPVRLAFDLAATLDDRAYRSVIEQMLHEEMVSCETLASIGRRLVHPTRPGSRRFVETMATRSGAALESDPEFVVASALWARGVPVVAQETWLDLPNGKRARIDLSISELRWGVEIDIHPDHLGINGTAADKRRDRQCHLIGWEIERVTTLDLLDLDQTIDELSSLYRTRRTEVA